MRDCNIPGPDADANRGLDCIVGWNGIAETYYFEPLPKKDLPITQLRLLWRLGASAG